MNGTHALEGRVHEAGVSMVDEPGRQTRILLFLFPPLLLPVDLLWGLLALVFDH